MGRDESLARLAKRYFSSRGPATVNDFSTWSGLTLYDCMIIFDGQITGTWKRKIKKKQIEFEYDLFKRLNSEQKELFNNAVKKFGQFYEMEVKYRME